ncbi:MAG TPA: CDP-alcohol phosphatidyltransferase family protein [Kofleriaceae bacterium]
MELDAVVLLDARSRIAIAGLTAGERAIRVARRVGATRVRAVEAGARAELTAWRGGRGCPLLIIRADQLVHPPLVAPLVAAGAGPDGVAIAVGPDGAYAGAALVTGAAADAGLAALARGEPDTALAATATARVPHGEIARHPIATPDERRAAHRLLYRTLIKPQDNAITRYLYRPVSFPLTRLLVWTPITPNQVSIAVAILTAIGCWLTAQPDARRALIGTALVLVASYVDCCDGEIARLKLLSSRLGAWLDTVIDELSTMGYMAALGWHCHLVHGHAGLDVWQAAIAAGVVTYGWSMYCIYYNIIVGVGSANSQDYAARFEAVPGVAPGAMRIRPVTARAIAPRRPLPRPLAILATYAPYLIRRDFITWCSIFAVALGWIPALFAVFVAGGVVTSALVTIDHLRLRRLQRLLRRGGYIIERTAR